MIRPISDAAQLAFIRIRSGKSTGQLLEDDWETVYRAVWPILVARVSKTGRAEFAPDAVQSTLLAMLSKPDILAGLPTITDFIAYATRAATNRAIDDLRRVLRFYQLDSAVSVSDERGYGPDPLVLYAPRLSAEEIDLMRMFYVEGKTYKEIAEAYKATERDIKTRMFALQQTLAALRGPRPS